MAVFTYSRVPAFNPNTSPVSVARSASGNVYDIGDTGFLTPLNLTLVATNTVTTTLVSDANAMFPDFTLVDRTECVFKSGSISFVLTTTTPIPGPDGTPGVDGTYVTTAAAVAGNLVLGLSDSTTLTPVPLPTGSAIDDSSTAYIVGNGTQTKAVLDARYKVPAEASAKKIVEIEGDKARRVLIGAQVLGVSDDGNVEEHQFDPTYALEEVMKAELDIVSHYHAIGPAKTNPVTLSSADDWTQSIVPELERNPRRRILYCFEIWRNNTELYNDLVGQVPKSVDPNSKYEDLVNTLQAIKDGGHTDRVYIAPLHEGNGPGGTYPWQMYDASEPENSPEMYKLAFIELVKLIREFEIGAKVIQWFLTRSSAAPGDPEDLSPGYVGDGWVDLLGVSYYNRSGSIGPYSNAWTPAGGTLNGFVDRVNRFSGLDVWVCESGCALSNMGEDKGQWYSDVITLLAAGEIPRVAAYVMFQRDTRKYDVDEITVISGTDMSLENVQQKEAVGRAINASRTSPAMRWPEYRRNLIPLTSSIPISIADWSVSGATTLEISTNVPTDMSSRDRSLKVTKTASDGLSDTAYQFHRTVTSSHTDFKSGVPYTLSFRARASVDKVKLGAGIRQGGGTASFTGAETIYLTNTWERYYEPFTQVFSDTGNWRLPQFRIGHNADPIWIEITDILITEGAYPVANSALAERKIVRAITDATTIAWNCSVTDMATVTLAGDRTLSVPLGVPYDGQELSIRIKQDATGTRTLALAAGYRTSSVAVTLGTTANSTNILTFMYDEVAAKWGLIRNVALGV